MRGYVFSSEEVDDDLDGGTLATWEVLVVNAVGSVIEFWGFKRNQGRVWALLYLRDEVLSAAQIKETLGLSKGAVSMIVRELEGWGVIKRQRVPDSGAWHFIAEVDLLKMIGHVFREREVALVKRVRDDLADAERLAKLSDGVSPQMLERLARMRRLSDVIDRALTMFLKTARLDVAGARDIFIRPLDEDLEDHDQEPP
jgi:DNA-binding transcriptional regulator GbsR (MarR family)